MQNIGNMYKADRDNTEIRKRLFLLGLLGFSCIGWALLHVAAL